MEAFTIISFGMTKSTEFEPNFLMSGIDRRRLEDLRKSIAYAKRNAKQMHPSRGLRRKCQNFRPGGREAIIQTPRDQTLLLNPADAKRFSQKIRRIVFLKPGGREAF